MPLDHQFANVLNPLIDNALAQKPGALPSLNNALERIAAQMYSLETGSFDDRVNILHKQMISARLETIPNFNSEEMREVPLTKENLVQVIKALPGADDLVKIEQFRKNLQRKLSFGYENDFKTNPHIEDLMYHLRPQQLYANHGNNKLMEHALIPFTRAEPSVKLYLATIKGDTAALDNAKEELRHLNRAQLGNGMTVLQQDAARHGQNASLDTLIRHADGLEYYYTWKMLVACAASAGQDRTIDHLFTNYKKFATQLRKKYSDEDQGLINKFANENGHTQTVNRLKKFYETGVLEPLPALHVAVAARPTNYSGARSAELLERKLAVRKMSI